MFRKSRKSAVTASSNASSAPQSPRFLQADSCGAAESGSASATFSVGASAKPKSPGFFSRLFGRSKDELKVSDTTVNINGSDAQPRRKSLWQRSKSILRPRSVLDRSESAVLDLPKTQLNIRGSGSAAELLMNEFPIEEFYAKGSAVDTDGLLMKIFEANHVMYEQLKEQERQKDAVRTVARPPAISLAAFVKPFDLDGLITPVSTATELEVCEQAEVFDSAEVKEDVAVAVPASVDNSSTATATEATNEVVETKAAINGSNETLSTVYHSHASNNQLENQLFRNESESFSDSSDLESSVSLESLIQSFNNRTYSLEGVDSLSLTEIANMFDCLTVNEPETLKDGSVRCVYENDNGSQESIRFHNWKQEVANKDTESVANTLRPTKSEEKLAFTEISVATEKKSSPLKQRSMSFATFSKVESQVPVDRRRSLGAKVSQIVAMFEGATHF